MALLETDGMMADIEKSLYKNHCDVLYYSKDNAEGLNDLNTAIKSLYAIEVGALSANTLNTPTYVSEVIESLRIDTAEWANRLCMMRSLLFGEDLDWERIQQHLENIPCRGDKGGAEHADG